MRPPTHKAVMRQAGQRGKIPHGGFVPRQKCQRAAHDHQSFTIFKKQPLAQRFSTQQKIIPPRVAGGVLAAHCPQVPALPGSVHNQYSRVHHTPPMNNPVSVGENTRIADSPPIGH